MRGRGETRPNLHFNMGLSGCWVEIQIDGERMVVGGAGHSGGYNHTDWRLWFEPRASLEMEKIKTSRDIWRQTQEVSKINWIQKMRKREVSRMFCKFLVENGWNCHPLG